MNESIVERFNSIVTKDDELYLLGDCILGDSKTSIEYLQRLNGKIHIILGNHDTAARKALYEKLDNVVEVKYAGMLQFGPYRFYLSHYPTITTNIDDHGELKRIVINLYGHTHQQTNFFNEIPTMYHVGVDSHNCCPVEVQDIINDIKQKIEDCKRYL